MQIPLVRKEMNEKKNIKNILCSFNPYSSFFFLKMFIHSLSFSIIRKIILHNNHIPTDWDMFLFFISFHFIFFDTRLYSSSVDGYGVSNLSKLSREEKKKFFFWHFQVLCFIEHTYKVVKHKFIHNIIHICKNGLLDDIHNRLKST